MTPADRDAKIKNLLTRNVEQVIERAHLEAALKSGKKLRVKLGIDPTSPDLHLGHAVVLGKLREFQDLGHKAVLIIGDFTATIGDPSGRAEARKPLTRAQVASNKKKYLAHASKIIDIKKAEVRHNSEWFAKKGAMFAIELASAGTMQQILRRADFKKRLAADHDITLLETLYPLLQGYDSVEVKADVELGGTDQTFNLLMGRRVQRHFGTKEQDIMTVPLLEGLDGVKKMSKSIGNYIALDEEPSEMFAKVMSVPDGLIPRYFMLTTDVSEEAIEGYDRALAQGENPKTIKEKLSFEIVRRYHGEKAAVAAADEFTRLFSKGEMTENIPGISLDRNVSALDAALTTGVVESKSEARRLIEQGGFRVNGVGVRDPQAILELKPGDVIKAGKRHFFRVV